MNMKKIANLLITSIVFISLAINGCSRPVGDDSLRLTSFLEVTYPGDSWSISDDPEVKVTNIGPEAAEVQVFRFTLIADDDVSMELPENCGLMYQDDPGELVLVVHCTGLWLEQNESLNMNFQIQGPWHLLELTSIFSRDAQGFEVYNDISANHPLRWINSN